MGSATAAAGRSPWNDSRRFPTRPSAWIARTSWRRWREAVRVLGARGIGPAARPVDEVAGDRAHGPLRVDSPAAGRALAHLRPEPGDGIRAIRLRRHLPDRHRRAGCRLHRRLLELPAAAER